MTPNRTKQKQAAKWYEAQLTAISKRVDQAVAKAVKTAQANPFTVSILVTESLRRYALSPEFGRWAKKIAKKMLDSADTNDRQMWQKASKELGQSISKELTESDISVRYDELMEEQVTLIKSLPLEASEKVHQMVKKGIAEGARPEKIIDDVQRLGEITRNRAKLIARTETSRAQAMLTQARAEAMGSPGYYWKTMGDSAVRSDHEDFDGQFIRWDDPPVADQRTGAKAHAGCIYNCRCQMRIVPAEWMME